MILSTMQRPSSTRSAYAEQLPGAYRANLADDSKDEHSSISIEELPRSASFPLLLNLHGLAPGNEQRSARQVFVHRPRDVSPNPPSLRARARTSTSTAARVTCLAEHDNTIFMTDRIGRRKSLVAGARAWISKSRGSPERKVADQHLLPGTNIPLLAHAEAQIAQSKHDKARPTPFMQFSKRASWLSSASRSPSPTQDSTDSGQETPSTKASSISSTSVRNDSPARSQSTESSARAPSPSRAGLLRRSNISQPKPPDDSAKAGRSRNLKNQSDIPPAFPVSRTTAFTGDNPVAKHQSPSGFQVKDAVISMQDLSKRKDELLQIYRALDNDYTKFTSKPTAQKAIVVRTFLLPFLRSHVSHPANKQVGPEDLDRRIGVLHKWWTGLLALLSGADNRYLSGGDRPVVLEAIIGIMQRPEWRLGSSDFAPLEDRNDLHRNAQTYSRQHDILTQEVSLRARALFIANLLEQMSIVVEKMSLKTAPSSLVDFCGKSAAYVFFFCPGAAEVLVKVWAVPGTSLRRLAEEYGIAQGVPTSAVVANFPSPLRSLGWTTPKAMLAKLHQSSTLPREAAKIDWHGAWVNRWAGRDSELFFIFAKHYHILIEEFIIPGTPLVDIARAPGFIVIQCQMLASLEATLHRQAAGEGAFPNMMDSANVLNGMDTAIEVIASPQSANVSRHMAENRIIALLRDFLSEKQAQFNAARRTFAAAVSKLLHAAAKKTSQFDHPACFVLCDFLEEALIIYARFQQTQEDKADFIDWHFWLEVCKKLLESQNTMTELRLFSLLYTNWNTLCMNSARKRAMCLDWLLTRETFLVYYQHWCPMVRSYFVRLLVWRICRFDGKASELDRQIYSTVLDRLKIVWAHYLTQKRAAKRDKRPLPSTVPCLPAPGRRLLIIRMDNQATAANLMLGYGHASTVTFDPKVLTRRSSIGATSMLSANDTRSEIDAKSRRRWSLLGKSGNGSNAEGLNPSLTTSSLIRKDTLVQTQLALEKVHPQIAHARTGMQQDNAMQDGSDLCLRSAATPQAIKPYRAYSFKFSLEWVQASPNSFQSASTAMKSTLPTTQSIPSTTPLNAITPLPANLQSKPLPVPRISPVVPPSLSTANLFTRSRRLAPPKLPAPAHMWLMSQKLESEDEAGLDSTAPTSPLGTILPRSPPCTISSPGLARKPGTGSFTSRPSSSNGFSSRASSNIKWKYAGRALSEWELVVGEYNLFVRRRRDEGVPSLREMEVPGMGVDGLRRQLG